MKLRKQWPLLLGVVVLTLWVLFLRPEALGGATSYTIVSGTSMEPTLQSKDLIVMRRSDNYSLGDIVTYRIPHGEPGAGMVIVHRLVSGNGARGFTTQGDNKPRADPWHPRNKDIVGALWLRIPRAGHALLYAKNPLVLAGLGGVLTVVALLRPGAPRRGTTETAMLDASR